MRTLRASTLESFFAPEFLVRAQLGRSNAVLSSLGQGLKQTLKNLGAVRVRDIERFNPATLASIINVGSHSLAFLFDLLTVFGLSMSPDAPPVREDTARIGRTAHRLADRLSLPPVPREFGIEWKTK
jgi:hypothetical protein